MALFDTIRTFSNRQLRQFGCICLILLPTIAWYWNTKLAYVVLSALLAATLMALAWTRPRIVAPLFGALMLLATPVGYVVGEIAILTLYLLVFCPIGLIFQWRKRDAMQISESSISQSYWSDKSSPSSSESYYHLY